MSAIFYIDDAMYTEISREALPGEKIIIRSPYVGSDYEAGEIATMGGFSIATFSDDEVHPLGHDEYNVLEPVSVGMSAPRNIAICGRARAGKSLVAEYLAKQYGYTEFAFGDALKRRFHVEHPWIPQSPKPRAGYQTYGQYMRAVRGADIWINACFSDIERAGGKTPVVISDVRQSDEIARCRAEGYVIIRVDADLYTRVGRMKASGDRFDPRDLVHPTEAYIDEIDADYVVDNGAYVKLAEVHAQVDEIMTKLAETSTSADH